MPCAVWLTLVNGDRYSGVVTDMSADPPRDPHIPDLVGLQEAADIMGMTKQAAHKMAIKGQLRGARVGKAWVFRRVVVKRHQKPPSA